MILRWVSERKRDRDSLCSQTMNGDERVKQIESERVEREQIKLNSMQHRRKIWFRFY